MEKNTLKFTFKFYDFQRILNLNKYPFKLFMFEEQEAVERPTLSAVGFHKHIYYLYKNTS